jgi:LPS-assembly protein
MSLRINFYTRAILAIVAVFCVAPSWGQSTGTGTQEQKMDITADSLSFGDGGKEVEAKGNVQIKRELMTLKADEVQMNNETKDLEAKGKVSLDDPTWKVKSADFMQFNLDKETGELQNGDLFMEQNHVSMSGQKLQKFVGQTYHVDEGFFTTCLCASGPTPWRISADQIDLTLEGVGIIRDGYVYVYDIPVLYIPYGFFPLQSERQTGFLVPQIGQSSKDGFRFLQPFYWAVSKSTDVTAGFDVETRTRLGLLGDFRTKIDQSSDFRFVTSYFNELWRKNADASIVDKTIAQPFIPENRWAAVGSHRYTTSTNWLTYSDFGVYSDDLFTRELVDRFDLPPQREREIQVSRFGQSQFGAFKGWGDTFFKGQSSFYQDFIQPTDTTLQRSAQVIFWGRRLLPNFPLEFRWGAEGVNYMRNNPCPFGPNADVNYCGEGLRLDLRPEMVLPFKLASYLSGTVSVAPRETVYYLYQPVQPNTRNISRELVEIHANVGTSLSRVFSWNGLGFSSIRHVIEPELSYFYVPGVNQDSIPIMDGVDRIRHRNIVTLAVTNRFWGKTGTALPASDTAVESLNPFVSNVQELGSLRLAMGYNFAGGPGNPFPAPATTSPNLTDLDISLRLTPTGYLAAVFDGGFNPGSRQITQGRATLTLVDPRPITRRVLDPDFSRPNLVSLGYQFLGRGANGYLALDANIDLDAPANCTVAPDDPRCPGAPNSIGGPVQNIVGNIVANALYHVTDNILFNLTSVYDVINGRFINARGAVKLLSACDCWTITLSLSQNINPAKTSFNFDFNLLGLGSQNSQRRSTF